MTRYPTYREDVRDEEKFMRYTQENYSSWVEFARNAGHGDVNPILVTGVDRTKDFAMMCYSEYDEGLECEFRTSSSGPWGTWVSTKPIYQCHSPPLSLPSYKQAVGSTESDNGLAESDSDEYNQCIFVRYYSLRPRRFLFPKIIKAAAGPHDPGARGHDGEGSLLQAQYDSDSGSRTSSDSSDGDWDNIASSDTSVDSGSDAVIHNPTIVR